MPGNQATAKERVRTPSPVPEWPVQVEGTWTGPTNALGWGDSPHWSIHISSDADRRPNVSLGVVDENLPSL
jgi:hypothetical protein